MAYDLLSEDQRDLLHRLAPLRDLGCVLYGSAAIALRLGHGAPVDFEFLSDGPVDWDAMKADVPAFADAEIFQDEPGVWTVRIRSVLVSLSPASGRVGTPDLDEEGNVLLASFDDLLAHKLAMLLRRTDAEDYRDIAALLESGLTLNEGLGAVRALYPEVPLAETVKALVYFEAGNLGEVPEADRAILTADIARFTAVADMPLLSRRLVAERDASLDSPRSTIAGAKSK